MSSAACAGCLNLLWKGEPFVIYGTEVFHKRCARLIRTSVGNQQKLSIADLEVAVEQLRRSVEDQERRSTEVSQRAVAEGIRLRRELDETIRREGEHLRELRGAKRDNARLESEVSQLRSELAITQAIGPTNQPRTNTAQVATPTPPQPLPESDPVDDAAVRFGLLELDPLK